MNSHIHWVMAVTMQSRYSNLTVWFHRENQLNTALVKHIGEDSDSIFHSGDQITRGLLTFARISNSEYPQV